MCVWNYTDLSTAILKSHFLKFEWLKLFQQRHFRSIYFAQVRAENTEVGTKIFANEAFCGVSFKFFPQYLRCKPRWELKGPRKALKSGVGRHADTRQRKAEGHLWCQWQIHQESLNRAQIPFWPGNQGSHLCTQPVSPICGYLEFRVYNVFWSIGCC